MVKDFPLVTETSLEVYAREVAALLVEIQAFQQPILVLFTAKDMLLAVSDLLTVSHLAQYKNGDVHQLKKRFEKVNNKSCLVQQVSGRELIFQAILL